MKIASPSLANILGIGLVVALLVGAGFLLPVKEWVQSFTGWVQQLGPFGVAAFAAVYVGAVILIAPTWVLTLSAGIIYGFWGIPLVVVSATIGATVAFLIARSLLREKVRAWAQKKPILQALDQTSRSEGWKVVGLLRLSPLVPFTLQNYFFGATDIPFWHFVIPTFLGIVPGTALYVYIGTLGGAAASSESLQTSQIVLFSLGLVATIVVIVFVSRKAKQLLGEIGVKSHSR